MELEVDVLPDIVYKPGVVQVQKVTVMAGTFDGFPETEQTYWDANVWGDSSYRSFVSADDAVQHLRERLAKNFRDQSS